MDGYGDMEQTDRQIESPALTSTRLSGYPNSRPPYPNPFILSAILTSISSVVIGSGEICNIVMVSHRKQARGYHREKYINRVLCVSDYFK